MSDPDRLAAAIARTDQIVAAIHDDANRIRNTTLAVDGIGAYGQYRARQLAAHNARQAAPRMTVRDLHAILTEHISYGRGDDNLYIYPDDELVNDVPGFMDVWTNRHNYEITDVDWTDDNDHFVTLTITRTPED